MTCSVCSDSGFIDLSSEPEAFNPDEAFCFCSIGESAKASGRKSPWGRPRERVRALDLDTALWPGPQSLEDFEEALDSGRAYAFAPVGRETRWVRLLRLAPTKRFTSGKFSLKYKVEDSPLYGWFLPSDLTTGDFPAIKIAPSAFVLFEDDPAARATFGNKKLSTFREG